MDLPADHELVAAVFERLLPADDYPGARALGLVDWLATHAAGDHARTWRLL